jgi:hypothetical protein
VIGHGRWRRDVVDGALGLLASERADVLRRHLEGCASCRDESERLRRALSMAASDPTPRTEPPVDIATLVARVDAEIDRRLAGRGPAAPRRRWLWAPAALAAAAAMVVLSRPPAPPPDAPPALVSADALQRMERTVNREQAARYLQDAQSVLLSVSTELPRCERVKGRLEVGTEAERSRALLAQRRLLVDAEAEHVAMARPLLEDVDRTLAEVASLDRCSDPVELRALARRISEERLLMKIDLMARELQG